MIFCVISESLGTAALSDYLKQQDYVQAQHSGSSVYNNDYIGIASYNIFSGIYVAFVFGGAFFFDLMFPERREDRGIRIAWRCCSVFATISTLADVIALTVRLVRPTIRQLRVADKAFRLLFHHIQLLSVGLAISLKSTH